MPNQPLVSVVIPTFNRATLLDDAIKSVSAQNTEHVEIIVVDDGSTDNTRSVLARYGNHVQYHYQQNQGPAAARNAGIERAKGEYIAFLDSDDVWCPSFLSTVLPCFEADPGLGAVVADSEMWSSTGETVTSRFAQRGVVFPSGTPIPFADVAPVWLNSSLFSTCCLVIRRSAIARLMPGPFDTTLRSYEDWDFELRMYLSCFVLFIPKVLARVRRYADDTRPTDYRALVAQYRVLERLINSYGLASELLPLARRNRAVIARAIAKRARGRQRFGCLSLAAREWLGADRRTAVRVLLFALAPWTTTVYRRVIGGGFHEARLQPTDSGSDSYAERLPVA